MKKVIALVLTLVSLFTFTTIAFAGDEPLYEANEIALELEKIFGYKPEVTLKIQDVPFRDGEDIVYFEVYIPARGQSYYWDAEYILGQYVLTEDSLWEMVDTYPSWELLPWESADGMSMWTTGTASDYMANMISTEIVMEYSFSGEPMAVLTVDGNSFKRELENGEYIKIDGEWAVNQSVLTDLYREWQER